MTLYCRMSQWQGVTRISVWGAHIERENRGAETGGVCAPPQKISLNFYIKMDSCPALWVAIN